MRLAFEVAISRADADTLTRWQPILGAVRGDGLLSTSTWSGPRDGQQRARA